MMRRTICVYAEHDAELYNGRTQCLEGSRTTDPQFSGFYWQHLADPGNSLLAGVAGLRPGAECPVLDAFIDSCRSVTRPPNRRLMPLVYACGGAAIVTWRQFSHAQRFSV